MKKRINVPLMVNGSKAQTLGTFLQDQHQPTELDKPLILTETRLLASNFHYYVNANG